MKLPSLSSYGNNTYFIYTLNGWLMCVDNEVKLFRSSSFAGANIGYDVIRLHHFVQTGSCEIVFFLPDRGKWCICILQKKMQFIQIFFPPVPYSLVGSCERWLFFFKRLDANGEVIS